MLDFKVDLAAISKAKELKTVMLKRLKQIDIENSGLITLDSLITIGERYGLKLEQQDVQVIRDIYRKGNSATSQNYKVDYAKVLADIKMKLDHTGNVAWAFGKPDSMTSPYRIKI